ncbi:PEP-CTERM domain protein [Thalassomonas viridans]|uniref:PEP-CTERM domain protein n=1 Tax=Thalassomonas viridans TaxID=137584 RepID=A0AAF0CBL1_9GAMM|nr:PEP-CTERM domain protein [Thalassomonas viridans]WDE07501.1 PEP-CTERM domain protein [Thalassomonas viridans]
MKNNNMLARLLLSASLCLASTVVSAALIQDNLVDNLYLSSGGQSSGKFNLNGLDYDYAKITFSFIDDTYLLDNNMPNDIGDNDSSTHERFYQNDMSGSSRRFEGWELIRYGQQNILETAGVNIGNISSGTSSSHYMNLHAVDFHTHYQPGSEWLMPVDCFDSNCADGYRMDHFYEAEGYTGTFTFETFLPKSLIDSSTINGFLNFDVNALSGDFYLASATLETLASVPEPQVLALFLLGLLGMGVGRSKPKFGS